ncbi:TetR/AcrR family transcriptional regulator [Microbacterium sp. M28]|uniref:TetR/AcrR family transcriptional regulator n=1 Tax=Microbacterium sp. M28 TaxID=2962064 RepID=UPI0021F3EC91|nr:TetR/AcrR family transcriptional regulator [Microbacterium sp. M28]UYO96900.1 TetR/AcrR family transcriptional regulator [Microbacterium sp. M28]
MPRPRSEQARQAVLAAMRAALVDEGYSSASIEGLAAAAGVSKQTIYRWWPSKAAILGEALLDGTLPGADIALPQTSDLEADLRAWFTAMSASLGDAEGVALARALIAVTATDAELGAALNEKLAAPIRGWVSQRLARAVEAGDVRADVDAAVIADQFVAMASYGALQGKVLGAEQVDAVVGVLMRGITS